MSPLARLVHRAHISYTVRDNRVHGVTLPSSTSDRDRKDSIQLEY